MSVIDKFPLFEALQKQFENRTASDNKLIYGALAESFPADSAESIEMLSYFIEVIKGPQIIKPSQYSKHSFLIQFIPGPLGRIQTAQIITLRGAKINEGQFVGIIDYQHYLNVLNLGKSSIMREVKFWESSELFCSMPRIKIFQLLRQAKVSIFNENEAIIVQGQIVVRDQNLSTVYVVRKGQFGYFRQNESKQVEILKLKEGNIFGALEVLAGDQSRVLTVRCKTQKGIVYSISQQVFKKLMLRYCDSAIRNRQSKLFRFCKNQGQLWKSNTFSISFIKKNSTKTKNAFFHRRISTSNFDDQQSHNITTQSISFKPRKTHQQSCDFENQFKKSLKIEEEGMRRANANSMIKNGPLKNYPLAMQTCNFTSSEFRVTNKWFDQKSKEKEKCRHRYLSNPIKENGVWKRDLLSSLYRKNYYQTVHKTSKESLI